MKFSLVLLLCGVVIDPAPAKPGKTIIADARGTVVQCETVNHRAVKCKLEKGRTLDDAVNAALDAMAAEQEARDENPERGMSLITSGNEVNRI